MPRNLSSESEGDTERLFDRCCSLSVFVWIKGSCSKAKLWLQTYTTDQTSTDYYIWLLLMSMAILYNIFFLFIRASFVDFNLDNKPVWIILDYCFADFLYLIDMFVRARTRYYEQGIPVYDTKSLYRLYFRSSNFVLDMLSIIPTDIALISISYMYIIVRLNRFFRYRRLFEMLTRVESKSSYPNAFRFVVTIVAIVMAIIYVACFYNSFSKALGYGATDEDFLLSQQMVNGPFFRRFSYCIFWATMTFCFIGEMPQPQIYIHRIIQLFIWIMGLMMFGVVVGRIATILDNMSSADDLNKRQLAGIRGYLHFQNVSGDVGNKVKKWYEYADEHNLLGSSEKALKPLPDRLKGELAMNIHLETLKKVQLFADLETTLLTELVVCFKLQVFNPQDFVCKKGDIGREMYVVKSGDLEVVSDDGSKVFVTLSAGSVFGEISLLSIPGSKTGNRRTANVRSKGFSDLFSLSKDDLYRVLKDYPGAMQKLVDKGTFILRKENKLDEDAIRRQDEEAVVFNARYEQLEKELDSTADLVARLIANITNSQESASKRLEKLENMLLSQESDEGKLSRDESPITAVCSTDGDGEFSAADAPAEDSGAEGDEEFEALPLPPALLESKRDRLFVSGVAGTPIVRVTTATPPPNEERMLSQSVPPPRAAELNRQLDGRFSSQHQG